MSKRTFPLFLVLSCSALFAQPQLTLSASSPVSPGSVLTVQIGLTGSSGSNIAAIGYGDPAGATGNTVGPASTAAAKTPYVFSTTVLLVGFSSTGTMNSTPFADGQISSFNYTVPATAAFGSTIPLTLASPLASSASGSTVALTAVPLVLTVGMNPTCVTDLEAEVQSFTQGPTQALINQITSNLNAAQHGGACQ